MASADRRDTKAERRCKRHLPGVSGAIASRQAENLGETFGQSGSQFRRRLQFSVDRNAAVLRRSIVGRLIGWQPTARLPSHPFHQGP